jgi:hypothetical protein
METDFLDEGDTTVMMWLRIGSGTMLPEPVTPNRYARPTADLMETDVLDEGDTVDVEEDAHEGELEYSPGGQDAAAQRQLWTAHSHPSSE